MTDVYIDTGRFERIAIAIAALEPCPFFGVVTADQVKMALGEHGDIWPEAIRADAELNRTNNLRN
jgi:hypothetical protein